MKIQLRSFFSRDEEGGITVLSIFLLIAMLYVGGLAIDTWNATRMHTSLQIATDAAAHSALVTRQSDSADNAKDMAVDLAEGNMPVSEFGNIVRTSDVEFGTWDPSTRTFTLDANASQAVRVSAEMTSSNNNAMETFLLKLLGIGEIDLNTQSVWYLQEGWCDNNTGFFAVGIVDIQSGNTYSDGFCVHSETHVEMNNGNTFVTGTTVSMPSEGDLVIPSSGMSSNPGLSDALTSDENDGISALIADLPNIILEYQNPTSSLQDTSYLYKTTVHSKYIKNSLKSSDIDKHAVNIFTCNNGTLKTAQNLSIEDVVIYTDCAIQFSKNTTVENAVVISNDTGAQSMKASSGFRIGDTDFCTDGLRGATLITMGGVHFASSFEGYGAYIIAAGDIHASAGAQGLAGVNFTAGGRIDNTSQNSMANCGKGPPTPEFIPPAFAMVQ